ncbi:MAG: DUF1700 domain-containing protein [Ruminococcus sp.]|nr:DUF1700 domain-containing protein [Ruminococcus sp.]
MTKKQYLAKLRKYLRFRLSNSEIDDILADMEECFEAGAAEGKSEEDICISLGEPKSAAASLLNEQTGSERITSLAEVWLPLLLSAALFAIYTYCGFAMEIEKHDFVLPIVCILPLFIWILFERKDFLTALADYKCDFFTFLGSAFMLVAGAMLNEMPKRTFINRFHDVQDYAVLMAVFVSAAMLMLAVSLWKNAPKPFSAAPLIGIFFIVYESARYCRAYNDPYDPDSAVAIGTSFHNILITIFVCASAFLIWSFIRRNALTLASAYSAMTVTGFMFFWYYTLSALDPTAGDLLYYLEFVITGRNYLIWGGVAAAAVLVLTIIVKLTKLKSRKKVG